MRVALSQIEPGLNRFEFNWPTGSMGQDDLDGAPRTVDRIEGWITVRPLSEPADQADLLVEGRVSTKVEGVCDRCLEQFVRSVDLEFKVIMVQGLGEESPEKELRGEELNHSLIEGNAIDLKRVVREQLVLDAGMVDLCSPDCRGLCPVCGCNLNLGSCDCKKDEIDPRLAALAHWRSDDN